MKQKTNYISTDAAANMLDVPGIAMGQIIFDNKLTLFGAMEFDEKEVLKLRETQPNYLATLR